MSNSNSQEILCMRCVRRVSDLRSYLRVGAILRHPDRGILRSSPHLIEPHAPSGALSSRVALFWIISMSSNRFSLSAIFDFRNIQKSQGAMSGLYGGWRSCTISCFAKNCCTREFREFVRDYWLRSYPAEAARALWRKHINAGRILFGHISYAASITRTNWKCKLVTNFRSNFRKTQWRIQYNRQFSRNVFCHQIL